MQILKLPTAIEAARTAADLIRQRIETTSKLNLGLATGGTMIPLYDALTADGGPDMRGVTTFNLDEYVGLSEDHPASYHTYMNTHLLSRLNSQPDACYLPKGSATDPEAEAQKYANLIEAAGGIDLQLLGLGTNGHIGFNEPGSEMDTTTRVVDLSCSTREANARFLQNGEKTPAKAISMGIATILSARSCLLLATGTSKTEAATRMIEGPIGSDCPATFLATHPDVTIVLDAEAAANL